MTDIEKKALALVNEVRAERSGYPQQHLCRKDTYVYEALCRAIEQHEAFRQEVSDAVTAFWPTKPPPKQFARFIIAKPVDPLVEALASIDIGLSDHELQKLKGMGVTVTAPARGESA